MPPSSRLNIPGIPSPGSHLRIGYKMTRRAGSRWIFLVSVLCLILPSVPGLPVGQTVTYSFVHLSDTQNLATSYPETYNLTFSYIQSLRGQYNVTAIIITGDLVNTRDSRQEWDTYSRARNHTAIPVYTIAGNHDADSGKDYTLYSMYTGEPGMDYAIPFGDFDLIGINYKSTSLPPEEAARLRQFLANSSRSNAIIATHYAMNGDGTLSPLGSDIDTYLVAKPTLVLTGHMHANLIRQSIVGGFPLVADLTNYQDGVPGGTTGENYSAGVLYTATSAGGRVETITARIIRISPDPSIGEAMTVFPPAATETVSAGDTRSAEAPSPDISSGASCGGLDPVCRIAAILRQLLSAVRHGLS